MMDEMKMCCAFKCPHDFTDNYKDCENMNKPECEECKRLKDEAIRKFLKEQEMR